MITSLRAEHKVTREHMKTTYGMHTHDQYEMVCFLHGDADLVLEGKVYPLKKGDILITAKAEAHFINARSTTTYERLLAVFDLEDAGDNSVDRRWIELLAEKPLGEHSVFQAELFPERHWQYFMERICSCTDRSQQEVYLRLMMVELAEAYQTLCRQAQSQPPGRATAIIAYINQNLCQELSLDALCSRFFLSKSQLNRIFKQATGSTVWNYILVKRLLHAKELLRRGMSPMAASEACGFCNYVSFYKAYQKHFGHAPREDMPAK